MTPTLISNFTVQNALDWGMARLKLAGLADPQVEVEALLSSIMGVSPSFVYIKREAELRPDQNSLFEEMVERRAQHEPVAYILNKKNFFGRDFYVNPNVLIPRPETEILAEKVAQFLRHQQKSHPRILEVGVGSGCLSVTLSCLFLDAEIVATDISKEALEVAKKNAETFMRDTQIRFAQSNIYEGLEQKYHGYFDIIISNPPYISETEMAHLEPDLAYEPRKALAGGPGGLLVLEPLIEQGPKFLNKSGILAVEMGKDQKKDVTRLFQGSGFSKYQVIKDYSGFDRIVLGVLSGSV